ncbi:hypothetical protein DIPPA_00249 [Diplonema papillatum]|nr:hypothetical protein DIPPA_00249 [Diplonema papillatum]
MLQRAGGKEVLTTSKRWFFDTMKTTSRRTDMRTEGMQTDGQCAARIAWLCEEGKQRPASEARGQSTKYLSGTAKKHSKATIARMFEEKARLQATGGEFGPQAYLAFLQSLSHFGFAGLDGVFLEMAAQGVPPGPDHHVARCIGLQRARDLDKFLVAWHDSLPLVTSTYGRVASFKPTFAAFNYFVKLYESKQKEPESPEGEAERYMGYARCIVDILSADLPEKMLLRPRLLIAKDPAEALRIAGIMARVDRKSNCPFLNSDVCDFLRVCLRHDDLAAATYFLSVYAPLLPPLSTACLTTLMKIYAARGDVKQCLLIKAKILHADDLVYAALFSACLVAGDHKTLKEAYFEMCYGSEFPDFESLFACLRSAVAHADAEMARSIVLRIATLSTPPKMFWGRVCVCNLSLPTACEGIIPQADHGETQHRHPPVQKA